MLPGGTSALFGAGGGPGAGSNDSFTVVMLHLDNTVADTNGAGIAATWVANGDAAFNAGGKFGACAGVAATGNVQNGSNAQTVGTKTFTIDFWAQNNVSLPTIAYPITPGGGDCCVYHQFNAWHCGFGKSGSLYTLSLAVQGSPSAVFHSDPFALDTTATWRHYAIVRDASNRLLFYFNGAAVGIRDMTAGGITSFPAAGVGSQQIMNAWNAAGSGVVAPLKGRVDEFRLSLNIARWLASFTPPAAPYA
jgi:concanavalin A-like lectin/glucanase superfamily protein